MRFTIRDLLWLSVVVVVLFLWRIEFVRVANRENGMKAKIELLKGALERAGYEVQLRDDGASVSMKHSGE